MTEKIKPFFFTHKTEPAIMTRPMAGDTEKVLEVHEWLEKRAIKSELDFPKMYWWLTQEDYDEFLKIYGEYKFT